MRVLCNTTTDIIHCVDRKYNMLVHGRKGSTLFIGAPEKKNIKNEYKCMINRKQQLSTIKYTPDKENGFLNIFNKGIKRMSISNTYMCKSLISLGNVRTIVSDCKSFGLLSSVQMKDVENKTYGKEEIPFFYLRTKRNKSKIAQEDEKQQSWNPDASLEKRYALALYNISKKKNILPVMIKDIQYLQKNLIENVETNNFFHVPFISQEDKIKALTNICKKSNPNNAILANFIILAFEKGRYKDLPKIFSSFFTIVEEEKEVLQCVVYTAKPLTDDKKKAVYNKICEISKGSYEPKIRYEVDPSILGGIIYHVGSNVYDFSTRERTNQILSHLT